LEVDGGSGGSEKNWMKFDTLREFVDGSRKDYDKMMMVD
jgi:hypothetical protein